MSDTLQRVPEDQFSVAESNAYRELEHQTEKVYPTADEIADYAYDVIATLNRPGWLREKAVHEANEAYVADEDFDPALRQLATVLIYAKSYSDIDARLSLNKSQLQPGVGNASELRDHIREDKAHLIDFDHALREWLTEYGSELMPSDVAEMIGNASTRQEWGRTIVMGVAGEIAIGKAIAAETQSQSGLQEVWYTTQEDDAKGVDLVVSRILPDGTNQLVGIDVKTVGKNHTLAESFKVREDDPQAPLVEMSVSNHEIGKGFVIDRKAIAYQLEMLQTFNTTSIAEKRHSRRVHHPRAHLSLVKSHAKVA